MKFPKFSSKEQGADNKNLFNVAFTFNKNLLTKKLKWLS